MPSRGRPFGTNVFFFEDRTSLSVQVDPRAAHHHTRFSLSTLLALGLGGLMLLAVGSVLLFSLQSASRNTTDLLRDKTDLILSSIATRIRQHLDPAAAQVAYLKGLIESGALDPKDDAALAPGLRAALSATPQVNSIAYVDGDMRGFRIERAGGEARRADLSDRPEVVRLVTRLSAGGQIAWGMPTWDQLSKQTILPVGAPVFRDGRFQGVVVSAITIAELSRYVARFSTTEQTAFVLYGLEAVIAHPQLATTPPKGSPDRPLPQVSEFDDPAVASIRKPEEELGFHLNPGDHGHVVHRPDGDRLVIFRAIQGYGDTPWVVGASMSAAAAGEEYLRLIRMGLVGLAVLVLAVLTAMYIGRRLSRPVADLVKLSEGIQRLDLGSLPVLPRSRIRELDAAGQALNSMIAALRWFELYLPRRVVHLLLARGGDHPVAAHELEVTVLFTDVCGFSRLAADLTPAATADFLNAHFGLLGACVEAEGGTIDKYIGDSMMVFWGAPDEQADHAQRACRAAVAIAAAVRSDNAGRVERGLAPVRVRIGVSSGTVIVGNIGAKGRVNYTLVGDVVNVAQRLEQLGKEIDGTADVVALMTEACHACLADPAGAVLIARREVRDRDGAIGIYRLI